MSDPLMLPPREPVRRRFGRRRETTRTTRTTRRPEQPPSMEPQEDVAVYSSGTGDAPMYHWHRTGTYADQYAASPEVAQHTTAETAPAPGMEAMQ